MVGMFLAILELVKQQVLCVEQEASFGEIWLSYIPEEERQAFDDEPPLMPDNSVAPELAVEDDEDMGWDADEVGADLPEVPDVPDEDDPPTRTAGAEEAASDDTETAPRT